MENLRMNWNLIDSFANDVLNDDNLWNILCQDKLLRQIGDDLYAYNEKYDFRTCELAFLMERFAISFS